MLEFVAMRKKLKGSPWRVVAAEAREDQHLWLEFADGNSGVVDMAPIFGDDASFDDLKDPKAFAGFEIAYHTVQWGEDRDICNHWLYQLVTGATDEDMYGAEIAAKIAAHA